MKILVLGAGTVGTSVAAALAAESNDITVVDTDALRLRELSEKLDLRTVHGHAAHPSVLAQAGAEDAELLIAVTNSDETNIIACQVADALYNTPTKIARVREAEYLDHPELITRGKLAINVRRGEAAGELGGLLYVGRGCILIGAAASVVGFISGS